MKKKNEFLSGQWSFSCEPILFCHPELGQVSYVSTAKHRENFLTTECEEMPGSWDPESGDGQNPGLRQVCS